VIKTRIITKKGDAGPASRNKLEAKIKIKNERQLTVFFIAASMLFGSMPKIEAQCDGFMAGIKCLCVSITSKLILTVSACHD